MSEVTREGATSLAASPWYNYALIVPFMFPWVVFLVVGLILAAQATLRRANEPLLLASSLLIVPLVVMSFFRDREGGRPQMPPGMDDGEEPMLQEYGVPSDSWNHKAATYKGLQRRTLMPGGVQDLSENLDVLSDMVERSTRLHRVA